MEAEQNRNTNKAARNYLDTLQRESWNLELIISGLALFGLISSIDKIYELEYLSAFRSTSYSGTIISAVLSVGLFAGYILISNLVAHLLLRGLWIGAVGLRSVSGEINFYQLKLAKPFTNFLRNRIGSFDDYILRLDRLCSIIFALSFLLVLMLISFILFFSSIVFITWIIRYLEISAGSAMNKMAAIALALYVFGGFIYLLDFIALGWLKRRKWLAKFYYPFYRLYGFITLARLYRPLYYNFIDDKLGRRVIILGLPYLLLLIFSASLSFSGFDYYNHFYFRQGKPEQYIATKNYYDNLRNPNETTPVRARLAADVISGSVTKLSLTLIPEYAKVIAYRHPSLSPFYESAIYSEIIAGFQEAGNLERTAASDSLDYLKVYRELFELHIDSLPISMEDAVLFREEASLFPQLVKYLPLDSLQKGLHQVRVTTYEYLENSDTIETRQLHIPFYYTSE